MAKDEIEEDTSYAPISNLTEALPSVSRSIAEVFFFVELGCYITFPTFYGVLLMASSKFSIK